MHQYPLLKSTKYVLVTDYITCIDLFLHTRAAIIFVGLKSKVPLVTDIV
jgi:hypothetical protein